jgi:phytoene synthase
MNDTIASIVRRHDPDRFLTALFAPPDRRDTLLTLYAFNHELARAREVASEPVLAMIRLQWWREVVEGQHKRHEVATPLSAAIDAGSLDPSLLLPLIEARETEAYAEFETTAEWRDWLLAGAGGLMVAAAAVLGAAETPGLRYPGAAYGVSGLLRSVPAWSARGICMLPRDLLDRHGLVPEGLVADPNSQAAKAALGEVARLGHDFLAGWSTASLPRQAIAAVLPGVLARRDLRRWPGIASERLFGDRAAVTLAGLLGRV